MTLAHQVLFHPGENPAVGGGATRRGRCLGQVTSEVKNLEGIANGCSLHAGIRSAFHLQTRRGLLAREGLLRMLLMLVAASAS